MSSYIPSILTPSYWLPTYYTDSTEGQLDLKKVILEEDFSPLLTATADEITSLVSQPLSNGELPLHYAVQNNKISAIQLLVKLGASPAQKDYQDLTATDYAVLSKRPLLINRLFQKVVLKSEIEARAALKSGKTAQSIKEIYDHIQNSLVLFNSPQSDDEKSVLDAIKNSSVEQMTKVLSDEMIQKINQEMPHVAFIAASFASPDILQLMIEKGVAVHLANDFGQTPVMYAATNRRYDNLQVLLKTDKTSSNYDYLGASLYSILAHKAKEVDPLKTEFSDILFTSLVLMSLEGVPFELIPFQAANISSLAILLLGIMHGQIALNKIGFNRTTLTRAASAALSVILLTQVPYARLAFSAITTGGIVYSTLIGLRNCYNNFTKRPIKATFKAILSSAKSFVTVKHLFRAAQLAYKEYTYMPEKPAQNFDLSKCKSEPVVKILSSANHLTYKEYITREGGSLEKIWSRLVKEHPELRNDSEFKDLFETTFETCKMGGPWQDLKEEGFDIFEGRDISTKSALKKAYHQLSLLVHPDKVPSSVCPSKMVVEAQVMLNSAYEKLKQ